MSGLLRILFLFFILCFAQNSAFAQQSNINQGEPPQYPVAAVLYDASFPPLNPDLQGWAYLENPPPTNGAGAVRFTQNGVHYLDTSVESSLQAGYLNNFLFTNHPGIKVLDRESGYGFGMRLRLISEEATSPFRAGFSVIILSDDSKGIEIGFKADEVWGYDENFIPDERQDFDVTSDMTDWSVFVMGDSYSVYADDELILSGPLRDYTESGWPYTRRNFIFWGDNTTSASSISEVSRISHFLPRQFCPDDGVLYVNEVSQALLADGRSWTRAYPSLQDALRVLPPCEIRIATGTYTPDSGAGFEAGNPEQAFDLSSGITLLGGFSGDENVADFFIESETMSRNVAVYPVILSGDLGNGLRSRNVIRAIDQSEQIVIDGVQIRDGLAFAGSEDTEPDNSADVNLNGGGLFIQNSKLRIINSYISQNAAENAGGGIYIGPGSDVQLLNSVVSDNSASLGAGLFLAEDVILSTAFSTFSLNEADAGGGVFIDSSTLAVFKSSIIWGNHANDNGPQLYSNEGNTFISYSVIQDIEDGGISGSWQNGGNNTGDDPKFETGNEESVHRFLPGAGSSATDRSDSNSEFVEILPTTDMLGNSRFLGAADAGALEFGTKRIFSLMHEGWPGANRAWHMLSSPVADYTHSDLLFGFETSDIEFGDDIFLPFLRWDGINSEWVQPESLNAAIQPGSGWLSLLRPQADQEETPNLYLPSAVFATGAEHPEIVEVLVGNTVNELKPWLSGWEMAGNPWSVPISVDALLARLSKPDGFTRINQHIYIWEALPNGTFGFRALREGSDEFLRPFESFIFRYTDPLIARIPVELRKSELMFTDVNSVLSAESAGACETDNAFVISLADIDSDQVVSQFSMVPEAVTIDPLSGTALKEHCFHLRNINPESKRLFAQLPTGSVQALYMSPDGLPGDGSQEIAFDLKAVVTTTAANASTLVMRLEWPSPDFYFPLFNFTLHDTELDLFLNMNTSSFYEFETVPLNPFEGEDQNLPFLSPFQPLAEDSRFRILVSGQGTSSGEVMPEKPLQTKLFPAYPNPFNPSTQVPFSLSESGTVVIELYSLNGQRVAVLTDTSYSSGNHHIQLDTSRYGLSSGVYIIRMRAGDMQQTQKITLLK
ncbi:MAG: T9SS type A sorting domain-containing protein [Balneolales bacterium]|nr:T9SS type A sorting domain-containing protein [Balneolales bacterium]